MNCRPHGYEVKHQHNRLLPRGIQESTRMLTHAFDYTRMTGNPSVIR
jgi:hypothetical protein